MKLALFDLDNTLLAGDSDYNWGRFLVEHEIVDAADYEERNREFYEEYKAGVLDIHAFVRFSLSCVQERPMDELHALRDRFVEERVKPMIAPGTQALLDQHRADGATLVIITATNSFITRPIARLLGVPHLLATEPEMANGHFTGEIAGTPCFQEGKVTRLNQWLDGREAVSESWFYSDSINDAPLMEWADHAYAVDPCPQLTRLAGERGWPIISLRGDSAAR